MRLHLFGLADYPVTKDLVSCAFAPLCYHMAKMATTAGHEVIYYGCAGSDVPCAEFVEVCRAPVGDPYQENSKQWKEFKAASLPAFRLRRTDGDVALLSMGLLQSFIAQETSRCCEFAVGYKGVSQVPAVFPSYAWMHQCRREPSTEDAVIPHYLDPADWPFEAQPFDYLLFVGRLGASKGEHLLGEISARTGQKIIVAGSGSKHLLSPSVHYVGAVGHAKRVALFSKARALICPTMYFEPFGLVAIEALACGTPVISTDWGAFTETVTPDVGFRCRLMDDFVAAVNGIDSIARAACRKRFDDHYSLSAVWPRYEAYFRRLSLLG